MRVVNFMEARERFNKEVISKVINKLNLINSEKDISIESTFYRKKGLTIIGYAKNPNININCKLSL